MISSTGNDSGPERPNPQRSGIRTLAEAFAEAFGPLFRRIRGDERKPIETIEQLERFVSTRSAFVAQKTLYGYLKTRMGTQFARIFQDEKFGESIRIASIRIFTACLSDLSIHAAAVASKRNGNNQKQRLEMAISFCRKGLEDNQERAPSPDWLEKEINAFRERVNHVDWEAAEVRPEHFRLSIAALVEWAPVAPQLKRFDEEIVRNSIRLAWMEIRNDLDKRLRKFPQNGN